MHFNRCISKEITTKIWETPASLCCAGVSNVGPSGSAKPTCNISAELLHWQLQSRGKMHLLIGHILFVKMSMSSHNSPCKCYVQTASPILMEECGIGKGPERVVVPSRTTQHGTLEPRCVIPLAFYFLYFKISASRSTC